MQFMPLFLALSWIVAISGDILAIDLGSQFFKVALVTTGKFEIVPNLQSKRKTPSALSVKSKIREFGDDALLAQAKSPEKVASFFRWFTGANLTAAGPETLYKGDMFAPSKVTLDETRGSPVFGSDEFGPRSMEEIVSHFIWYSKNLVEEHDTPGMGRHKIGSLKDVVITVPSWATKRERQALINAASIAGFTKVSLVHETSAAAVQRSLDLDIEANSTVNTIYLNVGASHFEACVLEYGSLMKNPTAKTLGCAHSLRAGGSEITRILAKEGGEAFLIKNPNIKKVDFDTNFVAKVRLFRQAEQVKQTLSANKEALFSVESLYEESDLKHPVMRGDIERIATPLLVEVEKVIESAISRSNLTRENITQAEVIGGGWRVPIIQAKLEEALHPIVLGQHLNGDEATVFGAAFIAANASSSFRVAKVVFTDSTQNEYSITVTPKTTAPQEGDAKWPRTQSIFPRGNKLNSVKAVKLSVNSDLQVDVIENGNLIESFLVSGRNVSEEISPQIILKAKIDSDGIFSLSGAEAVYESVTNSDNTTTETVSAPKKTKISLKVESVFEAKPLPMTQEQIKTARESLKKTVEAENAIKLRTKTKNDLEALVYSLRDKMEDDFEVRKHSSEEERARVVEVSKQAELWLDENGFSASLEEFTQQIDALKNASSLIFDRILEEKRIKAAEEDRLRKEAEELQKLKDAEEAAKKLQEELAKLTQLNSTDNITDFLNNFKMPNISDLNFGIEKDDIKDEILEQPREVVEPGEENPKMEETEEIEELKPQQEEL